MSLQSSPAQRKVQKPASAIENEPTTMTMHRPSRRQRSVDGTCSVLELRTATARRRTTASRSCSRPRRRSTLFPPLVVMTTMMIALVAVVVLQVAATSSKYGVMFTAGLPRHQQQQSSSAFVFSNPWSFGVRSSILSSRRAAIEAPQRRRKQEQQQQQPSSSSSTSSPSTFSSAGNKSSGSSTNPKTTAVASFYNRGYSSVSSSPNHYGSGTLQQRRLGSSFSSTTPTKQRSKHGSSYITTAYDVADGTIKLSTNWDNFSNLSQHHQDDDHHENEAFLFSRDGKKLNLHGDNPVTQVLPSSFATPAAGLVDDAKGLGSGNGSVAPWQVAATTVEAKATPGETKANSEEEDESVVDSNSLTTTLQDKTAVSSVASNSIIVPAPRSPLKGDKLQVVKKSARAIAITTATLWLAVQLASSVQSNWRYYLAGGICAAASHALPVPIDVIKTRQQVDPALHKKSLFDAATYVVRNDGLHALMAGLGPTAWGYLFEGAVKFGVYEVLKPVLLGFLQALAGVSTYLQFLNTRLVAFCLCGAVSGLAAAVMVCPMEAIRIRMVADKEFCPAGTSWITAGYKVIRQEGLCQGLFAGLVPMIYKQVPYTITKNVSFDFLTRLAYWTILRQGWTPTSVVQFTVPLAAALTASMLSCVSSQPGDMLLSLINAQQHKECSAGGCLQPNCMKRKTTNEFIREMFATEGWKGFFVGMQTRFLHVGVIVTMQLFLYDLIKRSVGIAATGTV